MKRAYRNHTLWFAYLAHRLSGVALGLFLPLHFWLLSYALTAPETLDGLLAWTDLAAVKAAEFGLVFLLAVHLFGGLRLMALEWLPWRPAQKTLAAGAVALSLMVSGVFLLEAL